MDSDSTSADTTEPDFDAADLADAILAEPATQADVANEPPGIESPLPLVGPAWSEAQRALFWLMLIALFLLLVGVAATSNRTEPPEPPRCYGDEVACCVESYGWSECCAGPDEPWRDDGGLFDAEERFADDPVSPDRRC